LGKTIRTFPTNATFPKQRSEAFGVQSRGGDSSLITPPWERASAARCDRSEGLRAAGEGLAGSHRPPPEPRGRRSAAIVGIAAVQGLQIQVTVELVLFHGGVLV